MNWKTAVSGRPARRWVAFSCVAMFAAAGALAQDFPTRSIRLIVPTPAGSGPDVDARQMAARLGPLLGQSVVVENRPGASARIAIELVAKSAPDGYTLLVGTPSLATGPALYANLPYDVKRDLVPVSLVSITSYALTINAAVPAKSVGDYVKLTRPDSPAGTVATYGIGTIPHLAGAWFAAASGTDLKFIHYNTSPPFNDLLAGQTAAIFDAVLPVTGGVKSGKLRMLAISGRQRSPMFPDVPTFAEAGIANFDPMVWIGVLAPAGTPQPIVQKLSAAIAQVAKLPEIVQQRREGGSESVGSTPEEFAAFLEAERAKWGAVIRSLALKLE
jgi:tripartite-type tricarboxylate transporter receptor subunit TctC